MQNQPFEVDAIKHAIQLSDLAKGVFNHPPKAQQTNQWWRPAPAPAAQPRQPEAK